MVGNGSYIPKFEKIGYRPLNNWFEDSHFHHLHHVTEDEKVDTEIGIHIPRSLHVSIRHSSKTRKNLDEMNEIALRWYLLNTPERINPETLGLYSYYEYKIRSKNQKKLKLNIEIGNDTRDELLDLRTYPHETYNFVIKRLIKNYNERKR